MLQRLPYLAIVFCLIFLRAAAAQVEIISGPMIGHVTDSNARIWLQLSNAAEVKIRPIDADIATTAGRTSLDVPDPTRGYL